MRLLLLTFCLLTCLVSKAQETGSVVGKLTDKEMNNDPLPFANVLIKGSTKGTTSDFDGLYEIANLEPGTYTVVFSYVGYETVEIPNVAIVAGKVTTINVPMAANEGMMLDEIVITTVTRKDSETALLLDQKKAVAFKTAIGAEELSRKGVSDVAGAVTKTTGVSKQEGSGSIFVRGLGDRYNITTLNGLPLPSNNPSNKNIILDIFTTDIVEYVGISKTFETQNYADFGGANINIVSKNFSGKPYINVGVGIGGNSNVLDLDKFYLQDGPSYSGFNTVKAPSTPLDPSSYNTSWDRQNSKNRINNSYSLSGGKRFNLGEESSLSTFITASFDAENKYTEGIDRGSITAQGTINSDFYRKSYKHNTNTTVMGSVNYKLNYRNSISFTSLFLNSTSQDYSEYEGENQNFDGGAPGENDISGFIKRGTYDQTKLFVNQLLGKHKINEEWNLDWAVGYSILDNEIPDRMQNTFVPSRDGSSNYTFFTDSSIHNHRYYQELEEKELSANLALSYNFSKVEDEFKGKATVGYSGKLKDISFSSDQYSFFPITNRINFPAEGIHNVDTYLGENFYDTTQGDRSSEIPQSYDGNLDVHAAYANIQYKLTDKLSAILGARVEQLDQSVFFITSLQPAGGNSDFSPLNFLPSLTAKYELNEKQNLKFAFSKTYTLPQFKEKVRLLFEEVNQGYEGNPNLYASTNYNVDLGWELYPSNSELISVTTFGKLIQNPINEMFTNSSSGNITYANTGDKAIAVGLEVELRKNIYEKEDDNNLKEKLSFGVNASYIYTNQDLDKDKVFNENGFGANFTFDEVDLSGASDLLANADVSFLKEFSETKNVSATLSYGYLSDKLAVIGTQNKGNMVDKAINNLDFVLKTGVTKNLNIGLSYKNILNPKYERVLEQSEVPGSTSGDVLVSSFKIGSKFSLSLNYKF